MAATEGARRMGHVANIMLGLSLFMLLVSFKLSLGLFLGGWLVYGVAHIIDGFAQPAATPAPPLVTAAAWPSHKNLPRG